jgi:hypothetical protein
MISYLPHDQLKEGYIDGRYIVRSELRQAYQIQTVRCFEQMRGRLKGADGSEIYLHAEFLRSSNDELCEMKNF